MSKRTMERSNGLGARNRRLGIGLGLLAVLYIAAVIVFLFVR